MRVTLVIVATALAALVQQRSAQAEPVERTRVALVSPLAADPDLADVRRRLRAELAADGFEVVDGTAREDPRAAVEAALEECGAVAAFAVVGIEDGTVVDVWLSDAVTHKTSVRRFVASTSGQERLDPSLLAVQAVELLRASLVELETERPPKARAAEGSTERKSDCVLDEEGCAEPTASARDTPPAVQSRPADDESAPPTEEPLARQPFRIGGGLAAGWVRNLGAQAGPTASLGYVSDAHFGVRVSLVGPLFGGTIEGEHGSADVRELKLTLAATYEIDLVTELLYLEPYLSVGGQQVYAEGEATPPYEGTDETRWAAAFDAGARLSLWPDSRFAFELGAHAAVTVPGIELRIAGEPIAVVDRPALYGTLGVVFAP